MSEFEGRLQAGGRIAVLVSRYHERVTSRLLEGAMVACLEAGLPEADVDVMWVSGAFELGVTATAAAHSGRYAAIVALGVVVRGETPHFDFVAGETAAALGRAATDTLVPIGFGLLTCDTMEQAEARAGGAAGNKGREAAEAAIRTADLIRQALEEQMLRHESRLRARALQLLYALEITGDTTTDAGADGVARITGEVRLVIDDAEPMVRAIREHQVDLDRLAQAAADNWRLERIATVERNILRIAIHELQLGTVPVKVVIDEALWLAHRFAGDRAPAFINGVLDRVARDLGRL